MCAYRKAVQGDKDSILRRLLYRYVGVDTLQREYTTASVVFIWLVIFVTILTWKESYFLTQRNMWRSKHVALTYIPLYTGCSMRNVSDFGRVFLMLKYTDITQNTYVQSWTVKEIMAREKCGLLPGPRTVPVSWQSYQCQSLSVVSYYSSSAHARLIPECAVSLVALPLGSHLSCIVLGTLRTNMTWVRVFL